MSDVGSSPHENAALASGVSLPGSSPAPLGSDIPPAPFAAVTILSGDQSRDLTIPPAAHTFDGFRQWALSDSFPEVGRISFTSGELIVDMSPEYVETHAYIKAEVAFVVYGLIRKRTLGRFFPDRVLFSNESAGVSTEPDAMFAAHSAFKSGRCQLVEGREGVGLHKEVIGSPNWVLEIVSRRSIHKDKHELRNGYFLAGIDEYWLIDALGDEIDFQILVRGDTDYVAVGSKNGWFASPTFDCSFCLTREKGEDGCWQYTLEMQEQS